MFRVVTCFAPKSHPISCVRLTNAERSARKIYQNYTFLTRVDDIYRNAYSQIVMRHKLHRFEENKLRMNLLQPGKPLFSQIKGNWHELYFKNSNPITVEIAAGRGEYTVELARRYPEKNFIAIDYKGDRLWYGAKVSEEESLNNSVFLRTQVELLEDFFEPGEISEIWLTFPGPRLKKHEAKKRLTHPRFLDLYKKLIRSNGCIHLKTDSTELFEFTLEELEKRNDIKNLKVIKDIYRQEVPDLTDIQTRFEKDFLKQGKTIKYLSFSYKSLDESM